MQAPFLILGFSDQVSLELHRDGESAKELKLSFIKRFCPSPRQKEKGDVEGSSKYDLSHHLGSWGCWWTAIQYLCSTGCVNKLSHIQATQYLDPRSIMPHTYRCVHVYSLTLILVVGMTRLDTHSPNVSTHCLTSHDTHVQCFGRMGFLYLICMEI